MNESQRKVIVIALGVLSIVLPLIFLGIGDQDDYHRSYKLIIFSRSYTTYDIMEWGLRARYGMVGVTFGILVPILSAAAAIFIKQGSKQK